MKDKIGRLMLGFLVFLLVCGISVPMGIAGEWWYSAVFVGSVLLLGTYIFTAVTLLNNRN